MEQEPESLAILVAKFCSLAQELDDATARELLASVNWHLSMLTTLGPVDPNLPRGGWENSGNTCYMDSVFMSLFAALEAFDSCLTSTPLSLFQIHLCRAINQMRSGRTVPAQWVEQLRSLAIQMGFQGGVSFSGNRSGGISRLFKAGLGFKQYGYSKDQMDAQEFFLFLAEALQFPKLVFYETLLHGAQTSVDDQKITTQRVLEISMDVDGATSLADLLKSHFHNNEVKGVNRFVEISDAFTDSKKGQLEWSILGNEIRRKGSVDMIEVPVSGWKAISILPFQTTESETAVEGSIKAPASIPATAQHILPILLKRYAFDGSGVARRLTTTNLFIPPVMDVGNMVLSPSSNSTHSSTNGGREQYILSLVSVICHHGSSLKSGHYISYQKLGGWIKHDDMATRHRVSHVPESQVLAEAGQNGYMLFYTFEKRREPGTDYDGQVAAGLELEESMQVQDFPDNSSRCKVM